ncbi:MAG: hypothetical protein ACE5KV_06455 [Thermoplasmata archaeon]
MAKEKKSAKGMSPKDVVRKELGDSGCVITVSTEKKGENLVGKLEVTDATNDNSLLTITAVGKPENISFSFGISCSQGGFLAVLKDFILNSELVRTVLPNLMVREPEKV